MAAGNWSNPVQLDTGNLGQVPDEPGIYEIGFYKEEVFNAQYVGRALGLAGQSNSLRGRF